ncbi:o-succinylbenzoate synthase [Aeromonas allosaccharophila]|uniref:o-succinylbenzoate synthase n=1 Tax=Aeromonas allosaccharophila TaxID=656 RepID=A0ABZ0F9J2_9GAMM|nr:o-succinylbenzoate synthase [Aeromonas allosaccharophila]WOE66025.1 o-succinylbenzoate synthase [Aeromonas allosaccharophila]
MTLALYRYQLPFTQPLTFHGKVEVAREGLLVRINDGWGEIAPLPGFSKENLQQAEAEALAALAALAAGAPPNPVLPSVQFGLDCARWTWPEQSNPLPEPYPLIQGSPQELLRNWKEWLHRTPSKAKLKVARYPMRDELALIRLLCDRLPSLKLVLDANQGWTREEAWTFCGHLDPNRIEYLEDPCADFADIAFVANRTGMPVALDELLAQGKPWEPIPQLRALVLKPTLLGSLANCEALIARARELRLKVIISSCFESDLGLNQLFHLASEWAPEQAPGLDTRRWMAGNLLGDDGKPDLSRLEKLYYRD